MKPRLAILALIVAAATGATGSAQATPLKPTAPATISESGVQLIQSRLGGRRFFRGPVAPSTRMRQPGTPSQPIPPQSTAIPPSVNR